MQGKSSYLILLRLILIIVVLADIIVVLVILVVELAKVIVIKLLEGEGFTSEPVDSPRDQLLLDIFAQLVVELQAVLDIGSRVVVLVARRLGRGEEVEEGLGRDRLLDDAGLLGGCVC